MDRVKNIIAAIAAGNPKPVYFLTGEEPYYIDKISQYIADTLLKEEEKGFNQMVTKINAIFLMPFVKNLYPYSPRNGYANTCYIF